jgi:hypothetical protein
MFKSLYFKNFCCLILLFNLLISPVFAQAKRAGQAVSASNQTNQTAQKCSSAWTGTITYTRTQSMSDNKTVERVSGRGKDTTDWQMKYNYKASVSVIESPEKNGSSVGRANINHSFSSIEKISAIEKNSCDRGKTWKDMRGESTSKTETSATGTETANVSVGVNSDGTYSVSVGIPPIKGKTTGSQTSSYSGQCTPKEGKNLTMPPTEMPPKLTPCNSPSRNQRRTVCGSTSSTVAISSTFNHFSSM